jgi:hypothetical protein
LKIEWQQAWENRQFRIKLVSGFIIFFGILLFLPYFFSVIEKRQGILLNDWVLNWIPAWDVSVPTFIIIWSMSTWLLIRSVQDPSLMLRSLCSIIILFSLRMITIMLFPLDPPLGLIPLKDPVSSIVYGGTHVFITKDLFFSGHTSVQFLIFLTLRNKTEKRIALCATIAVGVLVLVQHVHYTIDVLAAIPICWLVYLWGKKIASF